MKFTISGKLIGLNEYTSANRANMYAGSKLKKEQEIWIKYAIREAQLSEVINYPVKINITWYEANKRRDIDNITFATKFILDALVSMNILVDDNQKCVNKINNEVLVDKTNPRVEVEIIEKEEEK